MAATSTHLAGDGGKLKLYSYWRSSCAHRVRIALNLKGLDYEYKPVNLLKKEHLTSEYGKLNPVNCVPTLVDGNIIIAESLAIVLYLDDKYPENPLLPAGDFQKKAINLQDCCTGSFTCPILTSVPTVQAASIVASGIQPFQNLSVINYIGEKLGSDEQLKWVQSHINKGFTALEKLLEGLAGRYATGDEAQLADVFLAPQIYGGILRFKIDMTNYPTLARLHEAYLAHPAFQAAMPERQPDALSS